jgi:hypothetical protein
MLVYRIKHIPTGLYYTPVAEVNKFGKDLFDYSYTNLTKNGHIYYKIPKLDKLYGKTIKHIKQDVVLYPDTLGLETWEMTKC